MSAAQEPRRHVGAHPPESDHPKLHVSYSLYPSGQRVVDGVGECREGVREIGRQMEAAATAVAFVERFEIAEGLRAFERLERRHPRNREIERRVGGELEEDAGVRASLMK